MIKTLKYIDSTEIDTFEDLINNLGKEDFGIRIGNIIMIDHFPANEDSYELDRLNRIIQYFINKNFNGKEL